MADADEIRRRLIAGEKSELEDQLNLEDQKKEKEELKKKMDEALATIRKGHKIPRDPVEYMLSIGILGCGAFGCSFVLFILAVAFAIVYYAIRQW
jgi:hypothetical protein